MEPFARARQISDLTINKNGRLKCVAGLTWPSLNVIEVTTLSRRLLTDSAQCAIPAPRLFFGCVFTRCSVGYCIVALSHNHLSEPTYTRTHARTHRHPPPTPTSLHPAGSFIPVPPPSLHKQVVLLPDASHSFSPLSFCLLSTQTSKNFSHQSVVLSSCFCTIISILRNPLHLAVILSPSQACFSVLPSSVKPLFCRFSILLLLFLFSPSLSSWLFYCLLFTSASQSLLPFLPHIGCFIVVFSQMRQFVFRPRCHVVIFWSSLRAIISDLFSSFYPVGCFTVVFSQMPICPSSPLSVMSVVLLSSFHTCVSVTLQIMAPCYNQSQPPWYQGL